MTEVITARMVETEARSFMLEVIKVNLWLLGRKGGLLKTLKTEDLRSDDEVRKENSWVRTHDIYTDFVPPADPVEKKLCSRIQSIGTPAGIRQPPQGNCYYIISNYRRNSKNWECCVMV